MTSELPFSQLVAEVLSDAGQPLTLADILARVEETRPVDTLNPQATVRNALGNLRLAVSLGGRPARYVWWPRYLAGCSFRQPLASSDLDAGTLVLNEETRTALWPTFFMGGPRWQQVLLELDGGSTLDVVVSHLVPMEPVWGLPPTPALADWYRLRRAAPEDSLAVHVLDPDAHRYAVTLCRYAEQDEGTITARNWLLADAAEEVVRAGRPPVTCFDLIPRLIAYGAYRDPFPPDHWEDILRADLRFVVRNRDVFLAERMVDHLEREMEVIPDLDCSPRPRGDRRKLYPDRLNGTGTPEARRAWGEYLFDRGMDHMWVGWGVAAEAYYREALRLDPGHADAWAHLGNRCFEEGYVAEALGHYTRAQAVAEARTVGDPSTYPDPFWGDVDTRPFMRALHGRGLCLWRLGRLDEAREVFAWMLELNPFDNQGARFLVADLDEGLSWEESTEQET